MSDTSRLDLSEDKIDNLNSDIEDLLADGDDFIDELHDDDISMQGDVVDHIKDLFENYDERTCIDLLDASESNAIFDRYKHNCGPDAAAGSGNVNLNAPNPFAQWVQNNMQNILFSTANAQTSNLSERDAILLASEFKSLRDDIYFKFCKSDDCYACEDGNADLNCKKSRGKESYKGLEFTKWWGIDPNDDDSISVESYRQKIKDHGDLQYCVPKLYFTYSDNKNEGNSCFKIPKEKLNLNSDREFRASLNDVYNEQFKAYRGTSGENKMGEIDKNKLVKFLKSKGIKTEKTVVRQVETQVVVQIRENTSGNVGKLCNGGQGKTDPNCKQYPCDIYALNGLQKKDKVCDGDNDEINLKALCQIDSLYKGGTATKRQKRKCKIKLGKLKGIKRKIANKKKQILKAERAYERLDRKIDRKLSRSDNYDPDTHCSECNGFGPSPEEDIDWKRVGVAGLFDVGMTLLNHKMARNISKRNENMGHTSDPSISWNYAYPYATASVLSGYGAGGSGCGPNSMLGAMGGYGPMGMAGLMGGMNPYAGMMGPGAYGNVYGNPYMRPQGGFYPGMGGIFNAGGGQWGPNAGMYAGMMGPGGPYGLGMGAMAGIQMGAGAGGQGFNPFGMQANPYFGGAMNPYGGLMGGASMGMPGMLGGVRGMCIKAPCPFNQGGMIGGLGAGYQQQLMQIQQQQQQQYLELQQRAMIDQQVKQQTLMQLQQEMTQLQSRYYQTIGPSIGLGAQGGANFNLGGYFGVGSQFGANGGYSNQYPFNVGPGAGPGSGASGTR